MSKAYLLKCDGQVVDYHLPAEIKDINEVQINSYMTFAGAVWFIMHEDNDLPRTRRRSKLLLNCSMKSLFPESEYIGDIIAVKTIDTVSDELDRGDWSLFELLQLYKGHKSEEDHHLHFRKPSM